MSKSVTESLEELLRTEKHIEGTVEPKVVLFADLVGSTRYKATHPVVDGLKRTLVHNLIVSNAIVGAGGTVVKFIGDEVMGVFDCATSAVEAGVAAHIGLTKTSFAPAIQSKMAVHRGPIVYFRYEQATTLDPQGTTVDVAARIVSCSRANQILVSGQVRNSLSESITATDGKPFIPKGTRESIIVHAIDFPGSNTEISLSGYIPFLPEDLEPVLEEAKEQLIKRNYRDAALLAKQILKADNRHPEAAYIYGVCCSSGLVDDLASGIDCLEQVLIYNPDHFRTKAYLAYLLWVKCHGKPGRDIHERLIRLTDESLKSARDHEDKYTELVVSNSLAFFLAERGDNDDLERAHQLCEKSCATHDWLQTFHFSKFLDTYGFVLMKLGKLDAAQEKFKQACEVDKEFGEALIHLGEVIQLKKKLKSDHIA
jgi:class 3 adenylate cyclase